MRTRTRGYTIVEVMMALSVLAVGGMGVVALQKFTVMGSLNARSIASASTVADSWIDLMRDESAAWNNSANTDTSDMPILGYALANADTWVTIPTIAKESPYGGGTPLYGSTTGDLFFCSQIRATWLGAKDAATAAASPNRAQPTELVRVDVRTWFAKNGRAVTKECQTWDAPTVSTLLATTAGNAPDPYGGAAPRSRYEYGFVYASGTVRRNTL